MERLQEVHFVLNGPNATDADFNYVTILDEPIRELTNTIRRTSHNYSSLPHCTSLRSMHNQLPDRPNHLRRVNILPDLPIDLRHQAQLLRIRNHRRGRNAWSNWPECVKRLGVSHLHARDALREQVTRRHVVSDRVAEHTVERILLLHVFAVFADH